MCSIQEAQAAFIQRFGEDWKNNPVLSDGILALQRQSPHEGFSIIRAFEVLMSEDPESNLHELRRRAKPATVGQLAAAFRYLAGVQLRDCELYRLRRFDQEHQSYGILLDIIQASDLGSSFQSQTITTTKQGSEDTSMAYMNADKRKQIVIQEIINLHGGQKRDCADSERTYYGCSLGELKERLKSKPDWSDSLPKVYIKKVVEEERAWVEGGYDRGTRNHHFIGIPEDVFVSLTGQAINRKEASKFPVDDPVAPEDEQQIDTSEVEDQDHSSDQQSSSPEKPVLVTTNGLTSHLKEVLMVEAMDSNPVVPAKFVEDGQRVQQLRDRKRQIQEAQEKLAAVRARIEFLMDKEERLAEEVKRQKSAQERKLLAFIDELGV